MNRRKSKKIVSFFIRLLVVLAIIGSLGVSAYFILDKAVVPSYFGRYGIKNLGELVQMVKVMHNAPDEKTFISNPYTVDNETSAVSKLETAGVPVYNGAIEFSKIADKEYTITEEAKNGIFVSDREMAAVFGQMLSSDYLLSVEYFKNLDYFDTLSFESKEIKIVLGDDATFDEELNCKFAQSAHVSFTIKLNTESAQKHMASEMDVPYFLLNLIMPDYIYMTTTYDVQILEDGTYEISNATIGINGRTPKQSRILLNMLITFIFPKEDEMTIEKLSQTFGETLNDGLKILGNIKFCSNKIGGAEQRGLFVSLNPHVDTPHVDP